MPEHTIAFDEVKTELCSSPILKNIDPEKPTCLQTDASKLNGLGYILLQQHGEKWHPIQCGSRFLTDTESRYAIVEIEMLAVVIKYYYTSKGRIGDQ